MSAEDNTGFRIEVIYDPTTFFRRRYQASIYDNASHVWLDETVTRASREECIEDAKILIVKIKASRERFENRFILEVE